MTILTIADLWALCLKHFSFVNIPCLACKTHFNLGYVNQNDLVYPQIPFGSFDIYVQPIFKLEHTEIS